MNQRIDFDAARSVDIVALISRDVKLTRRGTEHVGLCPFHNETTPSFTVYAGSRGGRFHCFGCGASGDAVDYTARRAGTGVADAARMIAGQPPAFSSEPEKPKFVSEMPPVETPDLPSLAGSIRWIYRAADGRQIGAVYRVERKDGGKVFRVVSWGRMGDSGRLAWFWHHWTVSKPLYGLERLAARPDAPVVVCEGEKAADAAGRLLPGFVAVSWPGGSNAVRKADWSPLEGRTGLIWPDADAPGAAAAAQIAELWPSGRVIDTAGLPDGFDAADFAADEDISAWLEERTTAAPAEPPPADDPPPEMGDRRVIPLGYDHGAYYYYSFETRQVTMLRGEQHARAGLCSMASAARYWEPSYPQFMSKNGFSWTGLADLLMTQCRERGIFDPRSIRGRGAWYDAGVPVLHLGDRMVVGGNPCDLIAHRGQYVYEAALPLVASGTRPLPTADANKLVTLANSLRWEKQASARQFAGWIALAPICGALKWRPSMWLTGASGAGKSYIVADIVKRILGDFCLHVKSNTTEAYLRQTLGTDALPVLFDEAEREDPQTAALMRANMQLVRQSSSDDGARIGKGGADGRPRDYQIRSMFLFQSINVSVTDRADQTRISVLGLREKSLPGDVAFEDIQTLVSEILTPGWCQGLVARSVDLIPIIRHNAEIFARAFVGTGTSRRMGDQTGTLMAGAYSLFSRKKITEEAAAAYISEIDWADERAIEADRDEIRLLRLILASRVRVGTAEASISRLIEDAASTEPGEYGMPADKAAAALRENGIRYDWRNNSRGIYVSTNHPALKNILKSTPWDSAWSKALMRLPETEGGAKVSVRFGLGQTSRAVWIPMSVVDPEKAE
jgi:putative DNA primase/helicase